MKLLDLPCCCLDLDIALIDLLFPDRLTADGREFYDAHGIDSSTFRKLRKDAVDIGNGMVKIKHRCNQLTDNGRCQIYDKRPQICRDFDCNTRVDCTCKGSGKIELTNE